MAEQQQQRTAHRRPFTLDERRCYLDLARMSWRAGSEDERFIKQLGYNSTLTEKQSRRLFRLWGATKEARDTS